MNSIKGTDNRCSKCILPIDIKGINVDENGVCNICRSYKKIVYHGEDQFLDELRKIKNTNKNYDCIVTLSGGRDSSYTLLRAVKDYDLKVLPVHYENPFSTAEAKENVSNIIKKFNLPIIKVNEYSRTHYKSFIRNFRYWAKKPDISILPIVCSGCKLMWKSIIRVAKKNNINCMLNGGNRFENTTFKKLLLGIPINEDWEKTFYKALTGGIKRIISNPRYLVPINIPLFLNAYLFGDPYSVGNRIVYKKIKQIDMFYYIKWDEREVVNRLQDEVSWSYPKHLSSWRFDCKVAYLKDYIYLKVLGITEKDDLYSVMIREGLISRDEALERVAKENNPPENVIDELLSIADINRKEFDEILLRLREKYIAL